MNARKLLLIISCLLFSFAVNAQTQKGTISGNIKTKDGSAAAAVTVTIKGTGKATQTDDNGNFSFKNLNEGSYTIKISAVGANEKETVVKVAAGANAVADLTLESSAAQLEEVNVSGYKSANQKPISLGKSGIAPRDLPQSVQIISSQVIADQQADRLGDVMKNVNGVALGANRGGVGENFFARGYSLGSNNIFKNGARTSIGGSPEASTLESVEVLKGSAALLYGGVTGGAVVNMVTKKPKFEYGGEVSMRTGSYDQYKPMVDVYGPISKKLAFRAISTYEKAGSFRDNVKSDRFYINPSLLYKVSEKTEVLLQGDYLKSDYTPDFGVGTVANKIVDFGRDKFVNVPWAYNNTNTGTAQLNVNHKFNENWKVNAIGSFQSYSRDYFGSDRVVSQTTAGIASRSLNRAKTQEYTYNQQINLTGTFNTGKIKHSVLVGVDADQSDVTSNAFIFRGANGQPVTLYDSVNLFDPSTYYGSGIIPESVATSNTVTPVYRYGAFVQDLIELTPKLKMLAGIRYTDQKNGRTTATTLATGAQAFVATKFDDAFSPKLGLVYQPMKATSLFVSYANNFTVNTGLDIFGAALPPSMIDQYDVGVKQDFLNGKLSANLTVYKIINNNISQVAQFTADGKVNSNTNIRELNGETTSDGLEIDLTGNILPGLNFLAGYSYNFYRYTNTADVTGMIEDVRLVGSTKNTANGSLFYTVQGGKIKGLRLGASAFYTGKRNGGWNDPKNAAIIRLIPLSAFTTVDLSAGYNFNKFALLAKISNIANAIGYFAHENYSINPIAPRQFVTTLSYKF